MRRTAAILSCLVPSAAFAGEVNIAGVTSSSSLAPAEGVSYDAKNLMDGKASSVWVEGQEGSGLGEWVQVDLGGTKTVKSFTLWNGNWYTEDFWTRHNRAKEIEVETSDGKKHAFTLKDEFAPETVVFTSPVSTSFLKIRVKSVHRGSTFNDTCLSEVKVMDTTPSTRATVAAYASSSVYPPDNDGSYEPHLVGDGLLDTMWCEGSKDGDGSGEWVSFDFGGTRTVQSLRIRNGNAYGLQQNMKGNRAKDVTLTFSDGSTKKIALKPSPMEQVIDLGGKSTSSVKLTVDTIVKGSEFNDLCISEAHFE